MTSVQQFPYFENHMSICKLKNGQAGIIPFFLDGPVLQKFKQM